MPREILIMRHAKSRHDEAAISDIDRSLSERGVRDIAKVCRKLLAHKLLPDHIYSSSAKRARQTATLVREHLTLAESGLSYHSQLYTANPAALLKLIGKIPDSIRLPMIVGHNPELDELLEYLCGEEVPLTANGKLMTTANIAHIIIIDNIEDCLQVRATLRYLLRPR